LTPIPDDELEVAADVLENFTAHWEAAKGDMKVQQDLIQLIVARVWVEGERVVGMSLRPNYHITVGLDNTKPTEIEVGLRQDIMSRDIIIPRRGRRALPPQYAPPNHDTFSIRSLCADRAELPQDEARQRYSLEFIPPGFLDTVRLAQRIGKRNKRH
jgi:hypothetical protein